MIRKVLFTAGLVFLLALFSGVSLQASQATRTLQPGHIYEFVGTDARVVSHINVIGAERYEFVELNAQDEIQGFGFSTWRISVSGEGRTLVTPLTPTRVSFDPSRLLLNVTEGSTLHRINISEGYTVQIRNTGLTTLHVRLNQTTAYDFLITNRLDNIESYAPRARFPQLGIPGGGALMVQATEGPVTVYFPSWWYNDALSAEFVDHPALVSILLDTGEAYEFHNLGTETLTLTAEPSYESIDFHFQYVVRGRDGHVIRSGDEVANQISVSPGEQLLLTPLVDAYIVFPYILADYVEMTVGEYAPAYHPLSIGESISITNSSPTRTHNVFVSCSRSSGDFSFDHVLQLDDEVSFVVHENISAARSSVAIPPGATLSITATHTERNLEISVPDLDEITSQSFGLPVITRHILRPGQSVYIGNDGEIETRVLLLSSETGARLDYVVLSSDGSDVETFGQTAVGGEFSIKIGESVHFTSMDYPITVHIPRIKLDNGVSRETIRERALHHALLSGSEVLQIENLDRRYNHTFLAIDVGTRLVRQASYAYEFVTESRNGDVLLYGMNQFGLNIAPHNHTVRLMPGHNQEVLIAFPEKWHGSYLRLSTSTEQPLYRLTLAPGRSLLLDNPSRDTFVLANNSRETAAGFYMRGPGQYVRQYRQRQLPSRILTPENFFPHDWIWAIPSLRQLTPLHVPGQVVWEPFYAFVPSVAPRPGRDAPDEGDIQVPARGNVRITAAAGDDLEIWMPFSWAQTLGLTQ